MGEPAVFIRSGQVHDPVPPLAPVVLEGRIIGGMRGGDQPMADDLGSVQKGCCVYNRPGGALVGPPCREPLSVQDVRRTAGALWASVGVGAAYGILRMHPLALTPSRGEADAQNVSPVPWHDGLWSARGAGAW